MVTLSRIDVLLNSVRDDLVKLREQYPIPTVDGLRVGLGVKGLGVRPDN